MGPMKRSKCRRPDLSAIYADISRSASQELCADESSEDSMNPTSKRKRLPSRYVRLASVLDRRLEILILRGRSLGCQS